MDFDLTEEQRLISDTVHRIVMEERGRTASQSTRVDLGELGWLSLLVPEPYGGAGGTMVDAMLAIGGLGRIRYDKPFISTAVIAPTLLARIGSVSQAQAYLARIFTGEITFASALSQDCGKPIRAFAQEGGYRLSGAAPMVMDYQAGAVLIVPVCVEDAEGLAIFLVNSDAPGVTVRCHTLIDGRAAADVTLETAFVDAQSRMGNGAVTTAWDEALDHGRAALCADAVGVMAELLDVTKTHLTNRKQFRVPLGSFQVLRHRYVDMVLEKERAETMAMVAAMACDEGGPDRSRLVTCAKATVGAAARVVGDAAIQLHGGLGLTEEYVAGRLYKRLLVDCLLLGSYEDMLRDISAGFINRPKLSNDSMC